MEAENTEDRAPARAEVNFHLELTPSQLKITHTALVAMRDGFSYEDADVLKIVNQVIEKLPDEHSIRAISIDQEIERGD